MDTDPSDFMKLPKAEIADIASCAIRRIKKYKALAATLAGGGAYRERAVLKAAKAAYAKQHSGGSTKAHREAWVAGYVHACGV